MVRERVLLDDLEAFALGCLGSRSHFLPPLGSERSVMTKRLSPLGRPGREGAVRSRWPIPVAGLAVLGAVLAGVLTPRGELNAADLGSRDADGDGLSDTQEQVMQTSVFKADTDGDGFVDTEEAARNTSAYSALETPLPASMDIGMVARGEGGSIHSVVVIYVEGGNLHDKELGFGFVIDNNVIEVPTWYLLSTATITLAPASDPADALVLIDIPFSAQLVHSFGSLSIYATLSSQGQGAVSAAAAMQVVSVDGVVHWVMPAQNGIPGMGNRGGLTGQGSVYAPIPADGGSGGLPSEWIPGEICYQTTQVVGMQGGIVIQEVITAECISGWDSYCKPNCAASVGSTYTTFDPGSLVGG